LLVSWNNASVFVFVLDLALKVGWPEYMQYRTVAIALFTLAVLFLLVVRFARRENRRRRKAREQAEILGVEEEDLVYTSLGQTFTIRRP
jgi:cbb3-type cytochrome oxidase subunit 3